LIYGSQVRWKLLLAFVIVVALGTLFRNTFWHYIDADATMGSASPFAGTSYYATVTAHMGHPVDVTCEIQAVDKNGIVAARAAFSLTQVDGKANHDGTLDVIREVEVNQDLTIDCMKPDAETPGRRLKRWLLDHPMQALFTALLATIVVGVAWNGVTGGGTSSDPNPATVCSHDVVYHAGGTATTASLTLTNETDGTEQVTTGVPVMNKTGTDGLHLGRLPCGTFVYISAQNQDTPGTISCEITADGVTIEQAESSGAYVIASCSGTA
jgi:hypothetical protein